MRPRSTRGDTRLRFSLAGVGVALVALSNMAIDREQADLGSRDSASTSSTLHLQSTSHVREVHHEPRDEKMRR